jgi:uncharacterized protein (DUF111 family)
VRAVVDEFCMLPAMRIEAIGHGRATIAAAGSRTCCAPCSAAPKAGPAIASRCSRRTSTTSNPEHFEYLMERLFEAGALDVSLMHLQMKKNRPGFAIRVVARPADRIALASGPVRRVDDARLYASPKRIGWYSSGARSPCVRRSARSA